MTAHELAKQLLSQPDNNVIVVIGSKTFATKDHVIHPGGVFMGNNQDICIPTLHPNKMYRKMVLCKACKKPILDKGFLQWESISGDNPFADRKDVNLGFVHMRTSCYASGWICDVDIDWLTGTRGFNHVYEIYYRDRGITKENLFSVLSELYTDVQMTKLRRFFEEYEGMHPEEISAEQDADEN